MPERKNFFDASRAVLMFLGIPLHAAAVYAPDSGWLVQSPDTSPAFHLLARFIHSFRIDAFFIIAGYFSLVLLRQTGAAPWYRGRLLRLGVPLVTFALLLHGPQEVLRQFVTNPGARWGDAAALAAAQLLDDPRRWVLHLWFLVDLLVLSGAAALVWRLRGHPFLSAPFRRLANFVAGRPWTAGLLGLPLLGLHRVFAEGTSVLLGEHQLAFWGVVDLHRVVGHAPLFGLGVLLAARPEVLARMLRLRWWSVGLGLGSATVMALLAHRFGRAGSVAGFLLSPVPAIFMAHLLFATTNRLLARPSARVLWLARSSFTVYLVHHPIIAALGAGLLGVSLSPAVEFAAVVLIATILGVAAHRVVLASPVLLFLFNGVAERRTPLRPTLAGTP